MQHTKNREQLKYKQTHPINEVDPQITLIIITIIGAITVALLGWIESGEPFNPRKFAASIGRAIIGGLLAALIFEGTTNPTIWTYVSAFLIGAGLDVTGHRLSGAIQRK